MRTGVIRAQHIAPTIYHAEPLAAFEAWRAGFAVAHPTVVHRTPRAAILRRIVMLRRAGDSFAEIARCCGISYSGAQSAYERLPGHLR